MSRVLHLPSPRAYVRELRTEFPRVVLVLAVGDLIASFGFSLFFPFLTIYLVEAFGASAAEAGLALAAYSACSIVSGVAGGWLADRIGRRPVLIGSITASAVLVVAMGQVDSLFGIAVVSILLGMIDPAFVPAARAAVSDVVPEARRPRAFGLLAVAASLGWIVGPIIGAGLSTLGYPVIFTASGLIIGIYSVVLLVSMPETRPRGAPATQPEVRPAGIVPSTQDDVVGLPGLGGEPSGDTAARARPAVHAPGSHVPVAREADPHGRDSRLVFAALLPIIVLIHAAAFQWLSTLPIYASGPLQLPTPLWGLLFSLNGIMIVLFQLRIAGAAERRSKPLVMALAMVFYAAGTALVAFLGPSTAIIGLAATVSLVTIGEMMLLPIEPSFVSDLSPIDRRGLYQGLALAAGGLGAAIGPPVSGWVLDTAAPATLWLGSAVLMLAAGGLLVLLSRLVVRPPVSSA